MKKRERIVWGVMDTETQDLLNRTLKLGVLLIKNIDHRLVFTNKLQNYSYTIFKTIDEFANVFTTMLNTKARFVIYAYNLNFDSYIILQMFKHLGITEFEMIESGGLLLAIKHKNVEFRELMCFLPSGIKNLAQKVGLQKGSWEESKNNEQSLIAYCVNDCIITMKLTEKFKEELKSNFNLRFSLRDYSPASLSHHLFFKPNFMNLMRIIKKKKGGKRQFIDEFTKTVNYFIKRFYYGGRCENFYMGHYRGGQLFYYDVNSLYPYVIYNFANILPYKPISICKTYPRKTEQFLFIGEIELKPNDFTKIYGIIPMKVKMKDGEKLIFVGQGKAKTILWKPEFDYYKQFFKSVNGFFVVFQTITQRQSRYIRETITKLYTLKKQKEGLIGIIAKILLNSFYGKFGQEPKRKIIKGLTFREDIIEVIEGKEGLLPLPVYELEFNLFKNTNFAIASFITAMARLHMLKLIHFLFQQGIEIYYTDTDSIIANKQIPAELVGEQMGKLKHEYTGEEGYFISPKIYALKTQKGWLYKIKGFNPRTFEEWKEIIAGKEIEYKAPAKIRTQLRGKDVFHIHKKLQNLSFKRLHTFKRLPETLERGEWTFSPDANAYKQVYDFDTEKLKRAWEKLIGDKYL